MVYLWLHWSLWQQGIPGLGEILSMERKAWLQSRALGQSWLAQTARWACPAKLSVRHLWSSGQRDAGGSSSRTHHRDGTSPNLQAGSPRIPSELSRRARPRARNTLAGGHRTSDRSTLAQSYTGTWISTWDHRSPQNLILRLRAHRVISEFTGWWGELWKSASAPLCGDRDSVAWGSITTA